MREIKFRVWIEDKKQMYHPDNKFHIYSNNRLFKLDPTLKGKRYFDMEFRKVIPMQFTGIKDRKDRGVYEGDIVKAKDYDTKQEYLLAVEWSQDNCTAGWSLRSIGWHKSELEVVGNIYENPELTKHYNKQ